MRNLSLILLLPLTGCGSMFMLNVGSAVHEAASVGVPITPEVNCAALAQSGKHIGGISIDAMEVCEEAVKQQKELDSKGKHK